jgi:hypothetical protein
MKLDINNSKVSGKGFKVESKTWVDDNLKFVFENTELHEVIDGETNERVGWLIPGSIEIIGDFTAHSEKGMQGKSVHDTVNYPLILDGYGYLGDFIPTELDDVNTEMTSQLLEKYKLKGVHEDKMNIHTDASDEFLLLLSTVSEYFLLQSKKNSIRIHDAEVLILDRIKEKVTVFVNKNGRLHINADCSISIGDGTIIIDGEEINPAAIVEKAISHVTRSLGNLFTKF